MGTRAPFETLLKVIKRHCKNYSSLNVLDLGCGKGAISVKLAADLKCNCYGIDAIFEFIESTNEKTKEYDLSTLCQFEFGSIRAKIEELDKFDIII